MATLDSLMQPIIVFSPWARAVATRRRASAMPPVFISLRLIPSHRSAIFGTEDASFTDSSRKIGSRRAAKTAGSSDSIPSASGCST